ncbi:MAG: MATE family efflux transporter, partial [Myxococcota bacterium]
MSSGGSNSADAGPSTASRFSIVRIPGRIAYSFGAYLAELWRAVRHPDRKRLVVLLTLAWPIILARASQSVVGFCDAIMTAPLGEDALAATTTGAVNTFSLVIFPMGTAFIVQSFASQFYGKGDLSGALRYAWYGLILAAIFGVVSTAALPAVEPILGLFPHAPGVHALMTDYMVIRLFSVGAVVGIEVLGNWYGGLGNTRLHMITSLVVMVLNIVFNWLLIEGNLGFPALGVEGAALSSLIASWVGFFLIAAIFLLGRGYDRAPGRLQLKISEFWRMLRFGAPNGVNWFLEFAAFALFLNLVIASLGPVIQAAMMVVIQINSVSFMPAFGLSTAGAILVGQSIGRGDHDDVTSTVAQTGAVAVVWQVGVGLVYVAIPAVLISWFKPPTAGGDEFLAVGTTLLLISVAWQLFDAWAMTLSETLRAAGDTTWCMFARLGLAWILFMPLSLLSVFVFDGGPNIAMMCIVVY